MGDLYVTYHLIFLSFDFPVWMQQSWFRSIVQKIQWSSLSTPTWPSISTIQKKYGSWNSTPIGVDTARDSRQFGNNWPEILMVTFLFLWPLKKKESRRPLKLFLLSNGKADADDFLSLAALSASDLWPNEFISIDHCLLLEYLMTVRLSKCVIPFKWWAFRLILRHYFCLVSKW